MAAITKVIFNMPVSLKVAVQKRARVQGITLTDFLNAAAQAFVKGDIDMSAPELRATPQALRRIQKRRADARAGKNLSPVFNSGKEVARWLKV